MNRKFLLLLLMSGCCEVQASEGGKKGPHSGYTEILGAAGPVGPVVAAIGLGAKALWDRWGTSSTSTAGAKDAAKEGVVASVEVEQQGDPAREQEVLLPAAVVVKAQEASACAELELPPIDPEAQAMSMIRSVVDVYVQNKTLFITKEPGTLKLKDVVWRFPAHNEEAMKQFCTAYNTILGAMDPIKIEQCFDQIIRLSNHLNGDPLDEENLNTIRIDVETTVRETSAERAKKAREVAKPKQMVRYAPSVSDQSEGDSDNDDLSPVAKNVVMPPSAEVVLADGAHAADVPVPAAFIILNRSDFNFDHVVSKAVNERTGIDQSTAQGNPRLFSYNESKRLLLMKEEGATEIPFAWKCEEEDQASIEALCVLLNRYLLERDGALAENMKGNFTWIQQQMGLNDERLQKPMSLQSGVLLMEDGFESAARGIVPCLPATGSEESLRLPSAELEPVNPTARTVRVRFAAVAPEVIERSAKVVTLLALENLVKQRTHSAKAPIGDWFLRNEKRIVQGQFFAHVNGNKIQFGSDEDGLAHQIPGLDSEEDLAPVCSSLNTVVRAFRGIEE